MSAEEEGEVVEVMVEEDEDEGEVGEEGVDEAVDGAVCSSLKEKTTKRVRRLSGRGRSKLPWVLPWIN